MTDIYQDEQLHVWSDDCDGELLFTVMMSDRGVAFQFFEKQFMDFIHKLNTVRTTIISSG